MNDDLKCCFGVFIYILFLAFGIPLLICLVTGSLRFYNQMLWFMVDDILYILKDIGEWSVIILGVYLGIRLA